MTERLRKKPDTKSLELRKLLKAGKVRTIDVKNYRAIRYGFNSISDFHKKLTKIVMCKIQLCQDHLPTQQNESELLRVGQLYDQYKTTILKCACCGESNIEFLTIDHNHNNGSEHHKESGIKFNGFSRLLFRTGFTASDYQILCNNCNISLGNHGYCPHYPEIKREYNGSKASRTKKQLKTEGRNYELS